MARLFNQLPACCVTLIIAVLGLASFASGAKLQVRRGHSIQAAINKAASGDKIFVEAGTYTEQLTIEKDGIALVGHGAILAPPASAVSNLCSGLAGNDTQAGICVFGSDVVLAPFVSEHRKVISVGRPVRDVSITGFQVINFSGQNIAVVGGKNVKIVKNKLTDGGQYGFLTAGSTNTFVADNTVISAASLRFIGICVDDLAGARVSKNHISGYIIAICGETPGAYMAKNDVRDCCIGAFIDPFIDGVKVHDNHIGASNPSCPPDSVFGILLSGATNTNVQHNLVVSQTNQTSGGAVAGLAVVDDQSTGAQAIASGNIVVKNIFRDNTLDLLVNTEGTGNVIKHNKCSTPKDLCAKH